MPKLEGLGSETQWSNLKQEEVQVLLREATFIKVDIFLWEQMSIIDLNGYQLNVQTKDNPSDAISLEIFISFSDHY